jgi:tricarballylate dehydrogenase
VRLRDADGLHTLRAEAVVMASGGFEANPRLRTGYLGQDWSRVLVRGVPYNTGRVTEAALEFGAQAHGDWSACHATIVDIDAPPFSEPGVADFTSRLSYPLSVMVNLDGERFVDEAEHFHHFTYAKYGRSILNQRRGLAIEIFDAKVIERLAPQYSIWPGDPVEAETVAELAAKLAERLPDAGLDTARLVRTVAEFNTATSAGEFDPTRLDGLATSGAQPEKTNWAQPIDTAPYRAYIVQCGITFTYGGIKINSEGAVLDFQGRPIPGLYGAGEVVGGLFYDNYPGGAGLAAGAVFGRRAGRSAAAHAAARLT